MPEAVRPIKAADAVADRLLQLIRSGEYQTGGRLPPERELAARFGVSRPTLRDAIRRLEMLGYLSVRQGDGTTVRAPDGDTIARPFQGLLSGQMQSAQDLMEFRRIIEPAVAAFAARRATPELAASFEQALERQKRLAERGVRLTSEDLHFHHLIAQTAGNAIILQVLTTLRSLLSELRTDTLTGHLPEATIAHHERITRAILSNNPDAAHAAMLEHLNAVVETSPLSFIPHAQS
ncbi:FadR/GntR family transcriptional regulator [Deinococcus peraridilitoris]|uniref:Transcriptional regulator n=1 Tax=Deinococcus peraridilitoris (strain DSM 19664 / LMG 22246 / CIP 109416 / KR-200) TaxID=937777 RepID=L0A0Y7_DEIPD|nr:FadR/GntR family transcriptional regulator [Deinococcus peraridilitoris]AFZ66847.1 transcriptional regulator [Deinococcus peraridilitoris DSM 19664]